MPNAPHRPRTRAASKKNSTKDSRFVSRVYASCALAANDHPVASPHSTRRLNNVTGVRP